MSDCWSDAEYELVLSQVKDFLWSYLHAGSTIEEIENTVANLTSLEKKELEYLFAVHFLISDELNTFIFSVPNILRNFSRSTQTQAEIQRGSLKGGLDCARTINVRYSKGNDRTLFVCKQIEKIYDVPENQFIKYLLVEINRLIENTRIIPKKRNQFSEDILKESEKWSDKISLIKYSVDKALKNVNLKEIDTPDKVNEVMIRRAENARNKNYETAVSAYRLHFKLNQTMDTQVLREFLSRRVLEPLQRETLFELYVLFKIIEILGEPQKISLIKPGAKSVATFQKKETISLFYQKSKSVFTESVYRKICVEYKIKASLRKPDIIVQFPDSKRFLIVEVKLTKEKKYTTSSIYKVLGYLADFRADFLDEKQKPKGVLVVWQLLEPNGSQQNIQQDIAILDHNQITPFFKKYFEEL